jgi:hypothetical protein
MRLTLIALLLAGCGSEPVSEFHATRQAAEQGDADAQFRLGYMYEVGDGVPEDDTEATKWWFKAAEQGHVEAQSKLGFMYDLGRGVPEDHTEAVKWYRKAAEQGDADAQEFLGLMYGLGKGIPENDVEAYVWLSISAAGENKEAKKSLAQAKARLTPVGLIAAQKRATKLFEQINATKAD